MKKCPFCAEEIQDEAIVCRYCGRDLGVKPPVAAPVSPPQDPKAAKRSTTRALLLTGIISTVVLLALWAFFRTVGNNPVPPEESAWYACEKFISQNLKSPTTAKYQEYTPGQVIKSMSDTYRITMDVDAQNSFGAMIRSSFLCIVEDQGDTWQLVTVKEQ